MAFHQGIHRKNCYYNNNKYTIKSNRNNLNYINEKKNIIKVKKNVKNIQEFIQIHERT